MEKLIFILLLGQTACFILSFLGLLLKKDKIIQLFSAIAFGFAIFLPVFLSFYTQKAIFQSDFGTKIWFCFFVLLFAWIVFFKLKQSFILLIGNIICLLFVFSILLKTTTIHHELPPALQSPWFLPHVCCYMIAYALLGINAIYSVFALIKNKNTFDFQEKINNIGLSFLCCAMFMGALWAKTIWANFWAWDIKEVFALLSVIVYSFLAINFYHKKKYLHFLNIFAFCCLLFTWFGVKYLTNISQSLHIYG